MYFIELLRIWNIKNKTKLPGPGLRLPSQTYLGYVPIFHLGEDYLDRLAGEYAPGPGFRLYSSFARGKYLQQKKMNFLFSNQLFWTKLYTSLAATNGISVNHERFWYFIVKYTEWWIW